MARRPNKLALLLGLLVWQRVAFAMPDVQVNGLLPNQVVVTIDGQQRILKAGKTSPEGVTLVSADSKQASFSWQGQSFQRSLNKNITSQFSPPPAQDSVRIERGQNGHFFAQGFINGRPTRFLVDTGAFTVAMDMNEADRLGIDWRSGKRFMAGTAGGGTPGYEVMLNSVTIGAITLNNIKGAVLVADSNTEVLLGMSFLQLTEMREEDNVLILRKKY